MYPSVETSVGDIFGALWNISDGHVVPASEDVVLKNGGKRVTATYLYADLADSSKLAQTLLPETTAKIIRSYVNTAARILRHCGGEIRSYDGDRVMAIFVGVKKNHNAVRAALGVEWAVAEVIRPAIKSTWSDGENFYRINHAVGIDTGEALIVRGGVRNHNDLISIGEAPNVAAKLSEIRSGQSTFITDRVRDELDEQLLYYDGNKRIWDRVYGISVGGKSQSVHGTTVQWAI